MNKLQGESSWLAATPEEPLIPATVMPTGFQRREMGVVAATTKYNLVVFFPPYGE